jgi:hypothetical protein
MILSMVLAMLVVLGPAPAEADARADLTELATGDEVGTVATAGAAPARAPDSPAGAPQAAPAFPAGRLATADLFRPPI